jgi:hypothetical protein
VLINLLTSPINIMWTTIGMMMCDRNIVSSFGPTVSTAAIDAAVPILANVAMVAIFSCVSFTFHIAVFLLLLLLLWFL